MDDEEPDHGDGGPAGCGVGAPRVLVPSDDHGDNDVAVGSACQLVSPLRFFAEFKKQ